MIGTIPKRPTRNQKNAGQCGAFVNDVIGNRKYGDTLASKARYINSRVPSSGVIFISNINKKNGHVGFVEYVDFKNDAITLLDSNRYEDRKTNIRTVSFKDLIDKEKIIGYENTESQKKRALTYFRNMHKREILR